MAILTADELLELRREIARRSDVVRWTKPEINRILQAIENTYEAVDFKTAIDAADPIRTSAAQQRLFKAVYNDQKAKREA